MVPFFLRLSPRFFLFPAQASFLLSQQVRELIAPSRARISRAYHRIRRNEVVAERRLTGSDSVPLERFYELVLS